MTGSSPKPARASRALAGVLLASALLAASERAALAQSGPDSALLAESLFREGRHLMDEKKYAEACPKLEESLRLDAAAGTLLALATCHEQQGKIASAWGEFTQSMAGARRDGRSDREAFAREHVTALEPRLPKVVIDVPASSRVADLQITRNGAALTATTWGTALPSDPGQVVVTASAPGHKPWTFTGSVEASQRLQVTVPLLEDAPAPVVAVAPSVAPATTDDSANQPPAPKHDYRVAAYVTAGAGVVALGFGTYFGLHALAKQSDSNDACPLVNGARACSQPGVDANSAALTSAHWADATLAVGAVAVGVGVVLYALSSPSTESAARPDGSASLRLRLVPSLGLRNGGAALLGTF